MRIRITGRKEARIIGCGLFCLFISIMSFWNRTLVLEPVSAFFEGRVGFEEMKKEIQENYQGDRFRKINELLTLNGGFARLEGRIRYNEVIRSTNGMLASANTGMQDTAPFSDNLGRFSRFLQEEEIPFLFILAPFKGPVSGDFLPAGVTDQSNAICDQVLSELTEQAVPFLDLRQEMSQTSEQVKKYFYRTDHHWNAEGAFHAFQRMLSAVQVLFPETKATFSDLDRWEKHTIPSWWLGTHGRRVGPLFGGVDDLDYYLPAFETEMARYSMGVWVCKGDFRTANLRDYFLHFRDYMTMDSYHRYIGGSYGLTCHRNSRAENRMKLLLIGDSFKEPVECFLSTEFTAVDVLDPRLYGNMSISDYVKLNRPDMVLVLNSFHSLTHGSFFDYGDGSALIPVEDTALGDLLVSADEGQDYTLLPAVLESGKSYVLTLDQIDVLSGAPDGANIILYRGEDPVDQTVFDIDYGNQFEYRWGFQTLPAEADQNEYQLRLYAGVSGGTEGMALNYQGIRLQEYLPQNPESSRPDSSI